MPTLIVLRHAKAEDGFGKADADRELTARGRADASAAGDRLRADGLAPDLVLCSPTVRTRQTLDELGLETDVRFEPLIYANDAEELLELVRETGDEVDTLLLVGHNPSVHQLVHDLAPDGAPAGFPTCSVAVIALQDAWNAVRLGTGDLVAYHSPKG
ncbi:histidine phosphatase family protein [Actinomadura logoneensis]|uniref:Histidine phosphatase family protein n=1 Tax=Actinomadura logoneensis TaxID=2293572 RepID=A0A372JQY6_9ACTN|nr:histidine phosphatase family protein [Actinomadura logoneensis]RFU42380.1 histidine phosphatase family protein [Actinomadura logoneensis]